jgi:hypothetical protein
LLAVVCVAAIILISTGVIILQGSLDPFTGGNFQSTSSGSSPSSGFVSARTISTSVTVHPTKTITLFSTLTGPMQQYSTYVTVENTTISGVSTQINRTVIVTEFVTVKTTEYFLATKTLTSTTDETTTLIGSDTATK